MDELDGLSEAILNDELTDHDYLYLIYMVDFSLTLLAQPQDRSFAVHLLTKLHLARARNHARFST